MDSQASFYIRILRIMINYILICHLLFKYNPIHPRTGIGLHESFHSPKFQSIGFLHTNCTVEAYGCTGVGRDFCKQ